MSVGDQVCGGVVRTLAVGHPDRRGGQPARRAVHEHHRHPAIEFWLQEPVVAPAGHDQQGVDGPGEQAVHQLLLAIRVGVGAHREHQAALGAGDLFDRPVQRRRERIADVLEHQPDRRRAAVRASQGARGVVAPVAQRLGGGQHPLAGLLRRADLVVDDAGHRLEADPGGAGDVVHRRPAQPIGHLDPLLAAISSRSTPAEEPVTTVGRRSRPRPGWFPVRMSPSPLDRVSLGPVSASAAGPPCLVHNLAMPPTPADIRALADEELADQPDHRRELFGLRLDRWWDDLHDGLAAVYEADQVHGLLRRLIRLTPAAYRDRDRDPELGRLDLQRTLDPAWFQDQHLLGYAAYAERFGGDLQGIQGRIDHLKELGVGYLHLMPLLQPRQGDSDGGYAVADYRAVRADLGTFDDLRALAAALCREGISLVLHLVLNHVAAEHAWARAARDGDQHYRDYFYVFGDQEEPDRYEATLPEVLPDFAPGSFSYSPELNGWVWTTFNPGSGTPTGPTR